VNDPIYQLDADFWTQMKKPYCNELLNIRENSEVSLKENFECSEEEIEDFVDTLEASIYNFTTDYIKKIFRDINTNLLRKFNLLFKKEDGTNKNRDWRTIEEPVIRELHLKIKNQLIEIIGDFKYIKIPRNVSEKDAINNPPKSPLVGLGRSMTIQYSRLLSEMDINRVKDKFSEDVELVLEEAIRKHVLILLDLPFLV